MTDYQITLDAINVEARDPAALAGFWAAVIDAVPASYGDYVHLPAGAAGFAMFFRPLTGSRPDGQISHLDLTVPWGSRRTEVERLISLGATHKWDVLDEVPHVQWTTLADPEGNLFCVGEHPPAGA
jgi:hypothetical protein